MSEAGVIIDEKTVGMWFLKTLPEQDWMATLREIEPDQKYEITYRFRYYKDDKAFDSEDEKHWYKAEATGTRMYCIFAIRSVAQKLQSVMAQSPLYEILNEQGPEQFIRDLEKAPFAFMRRVGKVDQ